MRIAIDLRSLQSDSPAGRFDGFPRSRWGGHAHDQWRLKKTRL